MTEVRVVVDGNQFDNWKSIGINFGIEDFTGTWGLTATDADLENQFPIETGSEVQILVNNNFAISGFVEVVSPSVNAGSHDVQIQGRGRLADLIDSTLTAEAVELKPPARLFDAVEKVLEYLGDFGTDIVEEVETEPFTLDEIVSAEAGDGCFDFLEKFARVRQVLLRENGDGNFVITRNTGVESGFKIQNLKIDNGLNNVLASSTSYNDSQRFHEYICVSQANTSGMNNFPADDVTAIIDQNSAAADRVLDESIRESRKLVIVSEQGSDAEQCKARAEWERNIRIARSFTYSVQLETIVVPETGKVFEVNTIVEVVDEDSGISEDMLIKAVSLNVSLSGMTASLELCFADSYKIKAQKPPKLKKSDSNVGF